MDKTPAPISLAAARGLPWKPGRSAEAFIDGDLEIRFTPRPTNGPQVPHQRDEFYIVAAGTGHYRVEDRVTAVGPGDLLRRSACGAWLRGLLRRLHDLDRVLRAGEIARASGVRAWPSADPLRVSVGRDRPQYCQERQVLADGLFVHRKGRTFFWRCALDQRVQSMQAPGGRARESAGRRSHTMSGVTLTRDDSKMLSGQQRVEVGLELGGIDALPRHVDFPVGAGEFELFRLAPVEQDLPGAGHAFE